MSIKKHKLNDLYNEVRRASLNNRSESAFEAFSRNATFLADIPHPLRDLFLYRMVHGNVDPCGFLYYGYYDFHDFILKAFDWPRHEQDLWHHLAQRDFKGALKIYKKQCGYEKKSIRAAIRSIGAKWFKGAKR